MIDALVKSAILFAIVAIATQLLKRRSPAAMRHLLWSFAIIGALSIPLLSRVAPFQLPVLPAKATLIPASSTKTPGSEHVSAPSSTDDKDLHISADSLVDSAASDTTTAGAAAPGASSIRWAKVGAAVWGFGVLILLARLLVGLVIVRRIAGRAQDITDPEWLGHIDRSILASGVRQPVDVRMSDETPVPYTCGLTQPTIVLPTSANEWNAERRDAVLLHELAHISRGDLAMNILSHVARAMYWPNPLAWIAANGLRYEGERACDDAVLRTGAKASDYADHLLDIVKSVGRPIPNVALAMARSSDFEGRLLAILEPGVPRTRLGRARSYAMAALFAMALVPLSAVTSASQAEEPTPQVQSVAGTQEESPVPQAEPEKQPATESARPVTFKQEPLPQASATIVALAEAMKDENAEVRLAAVNSLGGLQDPAAIAALAKALKEDTDARVREAAAWALGEIDDNRAVPHLLEALKVEKASRVRLKIVESLGQLDDPTAVSGVSAAMKDGSAEVRRAAVDALGEFEDQLATVALIGAMRDEDNEVRRKVANHLGHFDTPAVAEALTAMARDADPEVRANAIESLGNFDSQKYVPIFVAALKDSSAHVREHAADALGSVDDLRVAPKALIDLLMDPNRDVKREAAEALGEIGDEAAVPGLKRLVGDGDAETRRMAVGALKEIGGAEAMTALMALLKDPDPEVRRMSAEALGRKRP